MKRKFLFKELDLVLSGKRDVLIFPWSGRRCAPLDMGTKYMICQNGRELGLEKYRGTQKWRDRRAVPIRDLRASFTAYSAVIGELDSITGKFGDRAVRCGVWHGGENKAVAYEITVEG